VIAVPAEIEDALHAAARRHLPDGLTGGASLTAAVIDRSRRYTSERAQLAKSSPADLAARALFFTIADCAKATAALAERGPLDGDGPLRVVDLGAGAGAMTLGLIALRPARRLIIDAYDRDGGALAILADAVPAAARALGVDAQVRTHVGTLARIPDAELVLAGSVLNELADPEPLARDAWRATTDTFLIIEPALRETARALHALRARLIEHGAHVFAPCTHAQTCPMLADERDWCHEERLVQLPPRTARLAQVTGLRDGAMKYAYLTLRKRPGHVGADGDLRVVGHPTHSKGKHEAPACGADGLVPLRLLARHRDAKNRAFERARRGDVLRLAPPASRGRSDLTSETEVSVISDQPS
jgi:ribosomal protein RSM22 (predicted rRNA methylase)